MAAHDEDLEDDLGPAKELLEQGAEAVGFADDLEGVTEVLDEGVLLVELGEHEAGVCGEEGHDEDEDDARREAESGNDGGQRQDTQGDGLGDEDDTTLPVTRLLVCDSNENICFSRVLPYHQVKVL